MTLRLQTAQSIWYCLCTYVPRVIQNLDPKPQARHQTCTCSHWGKASAIQGELQIVKAISDVSGCGSMMEVPVGSYHIPFSTQHFMRLQVSTVAGGSCLLVNFVESSRKDCYYKLPPNETTSHWSEELLSPRRNRAAGTCRSLQDRHTHTESLRDLEPQ